MKRCREEWNDVIFNTNGISESKKDCNEDLKELEIIAPKEWTPDSLDM